MAAVADSMRNISALISCALISLLLSAPAGASREFYCSRHANAGDWAQAPGAKATGPREFEGE